MLWPWSSMCQKHKQEQQSLSPEPCHSSYPRPHSDPYYSQFIFCIIKVLHYINGNGDFKNQQPNIYSEISLIYNGQNLVSHISADIKHLNIKEKNIKQESSCKLPKKCLENTRVVHTLNKHKLIRILQNLRNLLTFSEYVH